MSAIFGLAHFPQVMAALEVGCQRLAHRGPDASGLYVSQNHKVGLGHQRLAVIDVSSRANQPFRKHGRVLVFNGEIYNYQQLRQELMRQGAEFTTSSDTEVVLEAYRIYGSACLQKFRGMFALVIFDERQQTLFFARDPFGIKPLFLYQHQGQLAFASELKALTAIIEKPALNTASIVASIMYGWVPENLCLLEHVQKFPAGHYGLYHVEKKQLQRHPYYDLATSITPQDQDERPALYTPEELERVLLDSVQAHLVGDVPMGALLNGALDSSLIAAMAKKINPSLASYTFTLQGTHAPVDGLSDDAKYARWLAEQLELTHHEIPLQPDIVSGVAQMATMFDEPIGSLQALNAWLIGKATKAAGLKVFLSGTGADALFAGHKRHSLCQLVSRYRTIVPQVLAKGFLSPLIKGLPGAGNARVHWLKQFVELANLSAARAYQRSCSAYSEKSLRQLLHPDLHAHFTPLYQSHAAIYSHYPEDDDTINRMCYTDVQTSLAGLHLTSMDRASMAASTEIRLPFVDKNVVASAFAILGRQKLSGAQSSVILKTVAENYLPLDIVYRPNKNVASPLRAWVQHELQPLIHARLLSHDGLTRRGWFNPKAIKEMVRANQRGYADYSQQIWQLLMLDAWLTEHDSVQPVSFPAMALELVG